MRFRPGAHILFWLLEAALIGGHFAFPDLPHLAGQVMFWAGVAGIALWLLAHLGAFDRLPLPARLMGQVTGNRDTKVGAAISYICFRNWQHDFTDAAETAPPASEANEALKSFRQAAADGKIPVWGKAMHSDVFEPVPKEYWLKYQIEWFSLLRDSATTEPAVIGVLRGYEFLDLMTNKTRIEAIWPKRRRTMRLQLPWAVRDA